MIRPARNMATRSQTASTSLRMCDVSGPMEPLLRALADAGVRRMTTREPSLEELFMSRYGDGPEPSGDTP